jgi:hypothetical protein
MNDSIPNGMRINGEIEQLAEGLLTSEAYFQFPGTTVVVCLLTTHHGHHEIGASFYLDPAEFDDEQARQNSRRDAMEKLRPVANFLYREKQYLAGATLEPAVPAPAVQEVGMGYSITRVPIVGAMTRPLIVGPGDIKFVERDAPPFVYVDEGHDALSAAMVEAAEVITRMYAAAKACGGTRTEVYQRELERLGQEMDQQLAAEIEETKQYTAGAGEELIAEVAATLHKGDLITADEAARVSGEAAESFKRPDERPETEIEASYLSIGELMGYA